MDEKKFNQILDEDFEDEKFKPLVDNRESIKEIRKKFAGVKFPESNVKMSDKQINNVFENMKYE